jgi:hypothetical protein
MDNEDLKCQAKIQRNNSLLEEDDEENLFSLAM